MRVLRQNANWQCFTAPTIDSRVYSYCRPGLSRCCLCPRLQLPGTITTLPTSVCVSVFECVCVPTIVQRTALTDQSRLVSPPHLGASGRSGQLSGDTI